jgi:AcrR family transcriptional regulator
MNDKKERILKSGVKLFRSKGFKKTKVSEITEMAGIATGSFYNYYDSKVMLFMEIYLKENRNLKEEIMRNIDLNSEPKNLIKQLIYRNYEGMIKNPILREWYNKDVFNKIEQQFRKESGLDQMNYLYENFLKIIEKWQKTGKMRNDIDSETIMAIFTAIITMETHKEEIGIQYFPQLIDHMIDFVLEGLLLDKDSD